MTPLPGSLLVSRPGALEGDRFASGRIYFLSQGRSAERIAVYVLRAGLLVEESLEAKGKGRDGEGPAHHHDAVSFPFLIHPSAWEVFLRTSAYRRSLGSSRTSTAGGLHLSVHFRVRKVASPRRSGIWGVYCVKSLSVVDLTRRAFSYRFPTRGDEPIWCEC
jgi:hypothetical protein